MSICTLLTMSADPADGVDIHRTAPRNGLANRVTMSPTSK
jgi:hypothetical protein